MGVTAIAEATQTPPGTAYRSLDALEQCGFISRYKASTQYQIGPAAGRLTRALYARFKLRNICLPFLRRLAYATSETTSLTAPVGCYGVRIAVVVGTRSVRSAMAIGVVGTLDEDCAGRAILASYEQSEIARCLAPRTRSHSAKRRSQKIEALLQQVRSSGYALEEPEADSDRVSLALPIRIDGRAIAAVAIDGPVVDALHGPEAKDLSSWQQIVAEIEALVLQFPPTDLNPFAALDPVDVARSIENLTQ